MLFSEVRAICTLVRKRTYNIELVSVVCRACGSVEETAKHIVTECTQLSPPNVTNTAVALGFEDTDGAVDNQAVRSSKMHLDSPGTLGGF